MPPSFSNSVIVLPSIHSVYTILNFLRFAPMIFSSTSSTASVYLPSVKSLLRRSWRVFLQHLRSCEDTCFLFIRFFYLLQGGEVHRVECFSRLHLSVAIVIALSFAPNMQNRERKPCFCSKANGIVVMLVSATMHLYTSGNTVSKHIIRSDNILHKLAFKNT